jgi:hypothetical protein
MPPQCELSHDDDMPDLEDLNREFQRGGDAVCQSARIVGRHQVGDIAHHENFARVAVENHLRGDP